MTLTSRMDAPPSPQATPLSSASEVEYLEYVYPSLLTLDFSDWKVKVTVILLGGAAHLLSILVTFTLLHAILGQRVPVAKKSYIMGQMVNLPFSLLAMSFCFYSIFNSSALSEDVVNGRTDSAVFFVLVTCGVYFVDTVYRVAVICIFKSSSQLVLEHHVVVLLGFAAMAFYDQGYFFAQFLAVEMVVIPMTIFVSFRTLRTGHSVLNKLVGFFAIHFFHGRNFVEGYICWKIYREWDVMLDTMPIPLLVSLLLMIGAIAVFMTPLWTFMLSDFNFNPKKNKDMSSVIDEIEKAKSQ